MPSTLPDANPFVVIISVRHLANLKAADTDWPIIQPTPFLDASCVWNIMKDPTSAYYTIQENNGNRYLVPGDPNSQSVLSPTSALWNIVQVEPGVNLYLINAVNDGVVGGSLEAGYPYADPPDAFAAVTSSTDDGDNSNTLWIIEQPNSCF